MNFFKIFLIEHFQLKNFFFTEIGKFSLTHIFTFFKKGSFDFGYAF